MEGKEKGRIVITAATIVQNVRRLSSLFSNNLFSDSQIVDLFNDGAGEIYDWMVGQFETWFLDHVDFTLGGGVGGNIFPMPMSLLLKDNTLEKDPTSNNPINIPRLSSWSDRNTTAGFGLNSAAGTGRRYFPAGSNLMIFPPALAAGSYRLWYTPKYIPILPPQPVPPLVASVPATFAGVSTNGVYGFTGSNWQNSNIGDSIIVTGAVNSVNNGTFQIVSVGGVNAVTVNNPASASEAPGAIAVTWEGPLSTFNVVMEPWVLYPEIHAAVQIRASRQQDTADLVSKLAALKQRIESATANRTEEVPQSPLRDLAQWPYGSGW